MSFRTLAQLLSNQWPAIKAERRRQTQASSRDAQPAPKSRPAAWDIPAQIRKGQQIAREELMRAGTRQGAHNGAADANRHAEWSRRMATEINPAFSFLAGAVHEIDGARQGQPSEEFFMDMMNNSEGIEAALEGRRINSSDLIAGPMTRQEHYEATTPNRTTYPSRPQTYPSEGAAREAEYPRRTSRIVKK